MSGESRMVLSIADVAVAAVKNIRNPLLLYGIVETAILAALLVAGVSVPAGLAPVIFAVTGLIPFVAICHFVIEYHTVADRADTRSEAARHAGSAATEGPVSHPQSINMFPASDSSHFRDRVETLVLTASRVRLVGTGINIIQRDQFTRELIQRVAQGACELEIYLADPASPSVQTRLAEEELGSYKPPVGRKGLESRLQTLLAEWRSCGRPAAMRIRLFSHYPTLAMLLIDDDYFFYPYGFATLGNFSPMLHLRRSDPDNAGYVAFLDQQYQLVRDYSVDAELVVTHRARSRSTPAQLTPFALYFVPPAQSAVYRVGTEVLGYDVRGQRPTATRWAEEVGGAASFGLHVTIADVLYFFSDREVAEVVAGLSTAFQEFAPFELTNFRLAERTPNEQTLSLVFDDPSGTLEALHHETVDRAYRRSAGSDYSLGLAAVDRDSWRQRARTMITHYRAPYVLGSYRPHLTLASNVPAERMPHLRDEIQQMMVSTPLEAGLYVTHVAVMSRQPGTSNWHIAQDLKLGA